MQPYPTTTQAAVILNLSRATVARYVREGVLRGCRIGRSWRVDPTSIERLLSVGTPAPILDDLPHVYSADSGA